MTPETLLLPPLLILAFLGLVTALRWRLWWVLAACLGYGALLAWVLPLGPLAPALWAAAGLALLAALYLARRQTRAAAPVAAPRRAKKGAPGIVVDGTNVMFWDGEADLRVLRAVVDHLKARGLAPHVFLDASSRHHLGERELDEGGFARRLGLPKGRVMVCPAGTEADAFLLKFARAEGLAIVSNDRFADRAGQRRGLRLVKGVFAGGRPILEGL